MGEFTADWLNLREAVDARSRNGELTRRLRTWRRDRPTLTVLDLGTGAGSNVRFLAPSLQGTQRWVLVDNDPALLNHLEPRLLQWAKTQNLDARRENSSLRLQGGRGDYRLETRRLNLATDLAALDFQGFDLVTASALLDLVSTGWLDRFARHCRDADVSVFLTLTYDGLISWQPEDPDDALIRASINVHQRGNKGFGPALGPEAANYAVACLQRVGYRVFTGRSDWHLSNDDRQVQAALLAGYGETALQQGHSAPWVNAWLARRHNQWGQPSNRLTVGHRDIFATF